MSKLAFTHLKDFNTTEGYWSTTDCIVVAEDILNRTGAKTMLEIGFNIGYSAAVWLEAGIKHLYIIDINQHKDTFSALTATTITYLNKKIAWLLADSTSEEARAWSIHPIDIAFIDGGHSYRVCMSDSLLSIDKGAKWLVYDDAIEGHSNGIWDVITTLESEGKIELVCAYPMTWTEQGYVVLVKVLK